MRAVQKVKRFSTEGTEGTEKKRRKSEKDRGVYRRDAEDAEKTVVRVIPQSKSQQRSQSQQQLKFKRAGETPALLACAVLDGAGGGLGLDGYLGGHAVGTADEGVYVGQVFAAAS